MSRLAKKKITRKKPVPKKPVPKKPVPKKLGRKPASGAKKVSPVGASLAARLVTAPRLSEPKAAEARIAEWLAGVRLSQAKALKSVLAAYPIAATLLESLSECSPFLWELASSDPQRLMRLLGSDPDKQFVALLTKTMRAVAATTDEAQAMRLLRLMKAEAALLIALSDIGGVWPVMRAMRALTHLADAAVDAATRFVLAEAARDGRL